MKYIRLLAMALLPLAFAACSDDEDFNGGAATVGFAESEISIKENITALNVPIVVQGDHTGLVRVNVEVKDATYTAEPYDGISYHSSCPGCLKGLSKSKRATKEEYRLHVDTLISLLL